MRAAFTLRLRVLHQTHLDYYTETFPIKTEHFSCWIFLHLISTLPPLYSGVTCNADSRERCTGPNNNSFIFPSLALPSPAPQREEKRRTETYQHFCHFRVNCIFSKSMCFSWSVVGYLYCLHFCWQLSFIIVRLNKDQVDPETREHCRTGFLCRNLQRKLSGLVFLDITDYSF